MTFDQRQFRDAVGCFATGVTIVTTLDHDGNKVGITANSFTSLSRDPPLVLFCVDSRINSFEAFESCRHFNINVLREDQKDLSNRFARSSEDKWDGIEHGYGENGSPMFRNVSAVLECDKHAMYEGGDHLIMVGEDRSIEFDSGEHKPLLYYRGGYAAPA